MSKKRFELRLCSNNDYYLYENNGLIIPYIDFDNHNKESAKKVVELLNTLHQENKQLNMSPRCDPNEIESMVKEIHCLKEENNQLKSSNMELEEKNNQLQEQKQQTEKRIQYWHTLYKELYDKVNR